MSLAKKCDRCESYYKHKSITHNGRNINAIGTLDRELDNCSYSTRDIIDLCPECLESFCKWLSNEEEKANG